MNMKKLLVPAFIAVTMMANAEELKLSKFLTNTSFSGDTRINHETTDYDTTTADVDKTRVRFRLNMNTKINDNFVVKSQLRLADDHQLTTDGNITPLVKYLELNYTMKNHTIVAGRSAGPFYKISNMFITDGEKDVIGYLGKYGNTELRTGWMFMANTSGTHGVTNATTSTENSDRQHALYVQGVHNLKLGENTLKLEATGITLERDAKNTVDKDVKGVLLGADYTHNLNSVIEMVQVRGQYVQTDAKNDNTGYSIGTVFGNKNLSKFGDWKAEVEYKMAENENYLAKKDNNNRENVKIWAQTYVGPSTDLEIEYNKSNTLDLDKASGKKKSDALDNSKLSVSLNYKF